MENLETEFQDKEIICGDCSTAFVFTADEQQFYQEMEFTHEPKRCKPCRAERKARALQVRSRRPDPARQPDFSLAGRGGHPGRSGRGPGFPGSQGHPVDGAPLFKANFGPPPQSSGHPRGPRQRGGERFFRADLGPSPWQQGPGRRGSNRVSGRRRSIQRHEAVCSDCGAATQVPFRPNGVQPVYCRTCLPKHRSRKGRPFGPRMDDAGRE